MRLGVAGMSICVTPYSLSASTMALMTVGGAPIAPEILEFFDALGLLVLEGWGLTETAAPATLNAPDAYRFGTVGRGSLRQQRCLIHIRGQAAEG